ncbi:hypothetical protein [Undibacterium terreum]|uniref:Uncharacterized protein n=1 Tax=Undibacterium terreum TaxID=1224302 RepID=A0A916V0U6_9BURK|nr:hypothetical protein [Undibacterium terreum]GGD00082.1 hypothetical protein GCM10011396_54500 [Undibacterium terreum]
MDALRNTPPTEASQADTEFDAYHATHTPRMDTSRDIIRGGLATLRRYFAAGKIAQKRLGTTELED